MKIKLTLIISAILYISCSDDSVDPITPDVVVEEEIIEDEEVVEEVSFPTLVAISKNVGYYYGMKINSLSDNVEITNLSETLDLGNFGSSNVSFYDGIFTHGSLDYNMDTGYQAKISQFNFIESNTFVLDGFCDPLNLPASSQAGISGSENYFVHTYLNSLYSVDVPLYLNSWNNTDESCNEFLLGNGPLYNSKLFGNYFLGFKFREVQDENFTLNKELWLVDLDRNQEPLMFEMDSSFNFATINSDTLYLTYINGDYKVYDIKTNTLINEGNNNVFSEYNGNYIFKTSFSDNQMVFYKPSLEFTTLSAFTPILFNFSENIIVDLNVKFEEIYTHLVEKYNESYSVINCSLDFENEVVIIGCNNSRPDDIGLLLYCDFYGNILREVELPYSPDFVNIIN